MKYFLFLFLLVAVPVLAQEKFNVVDLSLLESEQVSYFEKEKEYIQVKKSQTDGSYYVNTFESPYGKGYQVVQIYKDRVEYIGYGPNAKDFTYTVSLVPVASSTGSGVDNF